MAEMTIRLQTDPVSGKKNIIVSLQSDEDMLPHEHEQQHRALVEKLLEGGIVSAEELGNVIIDRQEDAAVAEPPKTEEQTLRESQSESA